MSSDVNHAIDAAFGAAAMCLEQWKATQQHIVSEPSKAVFDHVGDVIRSRLKENQPSRNSFKLKSRKKKKHKEEEEVGLYPSEFDTPLFNEEVRISSQTIDTEEEEKEEITSVLLKGSTTWDAMELMFCENLIRQTLLRVEQRPQVRSHLDSLINSLSRLRECWSHQLIRTSSISLHSGIAQLGVGMEDETVGNIRRRRSIEPMNQRPELKVLGASPGDAVVAVYRSKLMAFLQAEKNSSKSSPLPQPRKSQSRAITINNPVD